MNKAFWGGLVVASTVVLLPTMAEAQPILLQRCSADSLDVAQATARIEWARKCGLTKNVGSPTFGFDTGIPASNGGNLVDYQETDPNRNPLGEGSFSGPNYSFEINYSFINTLFLSGGTTQSQDAWGYNKWSRDATRKRARPLYPTFGTTANLGDANNTQLWAHPTNTNDCNLYSSATGTVSTMSTTYYVNGYCEASCYTPDQKVLFEGGYVSILDALNARREDLITLSDDATLDNVKTKKNSTYGYTVETRDTKHPIYVITTASGGELRVTNQHPVINGEGRMVQAQTLKVGHELVKADGSRDTIVSIEKTEHFGKVYNVRPVSEGLVSNVLVAQGYLVGSSRFQNDDVGYMNRVILYRGVPAHSIP
jgi:hypothetical protein